MSYVCCCISSCYIYQADQICHTPVVVSVHVIFTKKTKYVIRLLLYQFMLYLPSRPNMSHVCCCISSCYIYRADQICHTSVVVSVHVIFTKQTKYVIRLLLYQFMLYIYQADQICHTPVVVSVHVIFTKQTKYVIRMLLYQFILYLPSRPNMSYACCCINSCYIYQADQICHTPVVVSVHAIFTKQTKYVIRLLLYQFMLHLPIRPKGKSHIALNPSRRCLTCGAKWTFCRTWPKNLWIF